MHRAVTNAASWILVAVAAGCSGQAKQEITAEEARAALLNLRSIRVITGGKDDPIYVDLTTGSVARVSDSTVTIGKFITCNLKENTWEMSAAAPDIHFFAHSKGRFERQADGTWLAINMGGSIS